MTAVRKTLLIYLVIWCVSVAVAAGSTLWLGLDARIPMDMLADGTVTKARSVVALWRLPGMLTFVYGALALAAAMEAMRERRRAVPVELSEDAQRALGRYGRVIRNTMIGFGVIGILFQVFTLLRADGVIAPLGLDREGAVRAMSVAVGLLCAYAGNVTPKIPYVRNRAMDAARHFRTNRFVGRIFLAGGIGYIVAALLLPFERMIQVHGWLILGMLGLSALRYAAAMAAWRREQRWAEREGLV